MIEYKQYLLKLAQRGTYIKQTVSNIFYDIRFLFANLNYLGWLTIDTTLNVTGTQFERYYYRELPTDIELQLFFDNVDNYSDNPLIEEATFGLILWLDFRIPEVARLLWEDLNLENHTISVFGNNNKSALLPLPDLPALLVLRKKARAIWGDPEDE
ncbi:hypothetical protein [Paenibacillus macquariensis]|uniref:Tyr recombinase domain-containing protein n=1 Tax=Paenibacillus macquariensis TaxID=948756 RepID=A0ABY1K2J0_9BACL|nr:hypothetical protein [Paenibacillus macquariensis]MEC0090186.1 hypothetical protein [Paenibacillus macquariensis]OAB39560.1 hypothetical protein PMSM_00020 [Paenibacillus macquariensis subsp. macquariensis]SIR16920.1 hypothetical protein SAMN05421578_1087 [Paenibacillus macquariensis]